MTLSARAGLSATSARNSGPPISRISAPGQGAAVIEYGWSLTTAGRPSREPPPTLKHRIIRSPASIANVTSPLLTRYTAGGNWPCRKSTPSLMGAHALDCLSTSAINSGSAVKSRAGELELETNGESILSALFGFCQAKEVLNVIQITGQEPLFARRSR
jgi:hypothetical protein